MSILLTPAFDLFISRFFTEQSLKLREQIPLIVLLLMLLLLFFVIKYFLKQLLIIIFCDCEIVKPIWDNLNLYHIVNKQRMTLLECSKLTKVQYNKGDKFLTHSFFSLNYIYACKSAESYVQK